ncbi:peptide ABC transporter substrate-binding protein [Deinococcus wulumuqiensis]|uniref:Diguanylate phosphodiesterase n=1 Tax=Deinococcus wulumuqiensis TaxID=980427 RepID=A0AAV4K2R9_9DEIO|nr:peptide ABC transporter substrate-binding protein [Deinococcus wulumuqiensis]QII20957.1 peptide ABC transporter substrate-binding protein [Deinococcus wulumuqiensis R12]GGI79448.1 diguanylate phosphodiesterase [Deinococcus wulumuqiensis]GGP28956.1 diguanylate phosphodiesterase [Deinococcus wulumuqiensis]
MKKLLALSALLLGAAVAGPANNSLIIGTSQEPPNIYDPWSTNNLAITAEINGWMGAGLMYMDNGGKMLADIATKVPTAANGGYKVTRNSAGKVTSNSLTFTIRPDAKWSDGRAITAADFEFWLKVINDDRVLVPDRDPWDKAKITRGANDRTFTITFSPPYLFAEKAGAPGLAPAHIMQSAWNAFDSATKGQKGDAVTEQWKRFIGQYTTSSNLPKVVAGPFKPTAWRPGNSLTLTRNPNYWRKPAGGESKYLKTVTYRFISNTNTLKVNVLSGQLDALATVGLSFDQALDMRARQGSKFQTYFVPGAIWEHVDINTRGQRSRDLGLNDERVRQALLLATDREGLTKALFQGRQPVSHTFVNPLSAVYNANVTKYPFNQARARQLLDAAGWKVGSDGIRAKGGKKMTLTFSTTAGNAVRERVQQILQAQWKAVGVQVNIQNYPASVFFGPDMLSKGEDGKWDLAMYAWVSNPLFEEGSLFKGEGIPTESNGYAGQNYSGWKSAEYDRLFTASQTEFNTTTRKANLAKMQSLWAADVPSLPLYFRSNPYTVANGLVNYTFSAYTQYPTWDAYRVGWSQKGAVRAHTQKE